MSNPHLERLFGPEISGQLPSTGHDRIRRTMLILIGNINLLMKFWYSTKCIKTGTYATWFTVPIDERYLLNALNYVVGALDEPSLCLQAANALRDLCDANRQKLAKHIASFGELHSRLPAIPVCAAASFTQPDKIKCCLSFRTGFRENQSHSINFQRYTGTSASTRS